MAAADIRHWSIGDVTVTRVVEVGGFADNIGMLFAGADAQWLKQFAWLEPHFMTPDGRMIISFQAFVVRTPTRRIMVDTCIGNDRQRHFEVFTNLTTTFLADLAVAGCPAETIDTVLCTHLHFDHVGWNTQRSHGRWTPTFPQARYLFGRKEWEHTKKLADEQDPHYAHYADSIEPILNAGLADFVETDHRLCEEIWLEPTHGHTAGHVSVRIRSKGKDAVITGDLMHHPVQASVPDKPGNFDSDPALACRTRREFMARYDNRRALVIGSHFADPTAGWFVRDGDTWRFQVLDDTSP
jgi:glyoxylase-like metal-dependent hydrolase (beta-lactamase superfamily II)